MNIKVNISDPASVTNAVNKIAIYQSKIESKITEVLSRLVQMGAKIVDFQYSTSIDDYDYEVSCIVNGDNAMIIAEGSDVMFLEFGAGVWTIDTTAENESSGLPPIEEGSYSQTEGMGQFRPNHRYWYYEGKRYIGIRGTHGFYFASDEIKEQAVNEAIKVFKK